MCVVGVCGLLAGCGSQSVGSQVAGATASPGTGSAVLPAPPQSYRFVLTSSCGERGLLGDYEVWVRDEKVIDAKNLDPNYPYQPDLKELPTLGDLGEMARGAPPETVVEFVVDENGLPQSLSLDPIPNGIDDEECYRVSELESLP